MSKKAINIDELMNQSGVGFGTSGARGLASHMTDAVCYIYTRAFLQYLESTGELKGHGYIGIAGDLRPSTDRIMKAAAKAVIDMGYAVENCGKIPSPSLAYYGLVRGIPTVMVTGSHIPAERNGIKYTKKEGEILKYDEAGMKGQLVEWDDGLFDEKGMLVSDEALPPLNRDARELYVNRYLDYFGEGCLNGKRVGVYQHSNVGRELMVEILSGLGAEVTPLGFSEKFIPVDTEAIRPEDVAAAREWAGGFDFDSIVSADGDADRPLISDETGKWIRGDVAGILCAHFLDADAVVTPVSCNTALEKCGFFKKIYRTRIGSPFVIEGMQQAKQAGARCVVGYEANGGFLLASDIQKGGKTLKALPTRDAVIVHIAILLEALRKNMNIRELMKTLPPRFTHSDRLKDYPTERSKEKIKVLCSGEDPNEKQAIEDVFGSYFGTVHALNVTDGLRITFDSDEIVHLRPSGNAPEFRCYTEADTETRAIEMNKICMEIMETWRNSE